MPSRRSIPPAIAILALAALLAGLTVGPAAARGSAGCHALQLGVSRHEVHAGRWVQVRGHVCRSPQRHRHVRIAVQAGDRSFAVKANVRRTGAFRRQIHVGRAWKLGKVHFRAQSNKMRSNPVTVKIAPPLVTSSAPVKQPPSSSCELSNSPEQAVGMSLPGCEVIYSDTGAESSPTKDWGRLQCVSSTRYSWSPQGGDTHVTATGAPQGDEAYRQVTVDDGDEFWGERCELGEDDWRTGPTAVYHEGDHYVTYISERLPSNFPLYTKEWQTVMQMKQTEPGNGGGEAPQIEMEAREGRWIIVDDWHELWSFPAAQNTWTRFAWNVYYSKNSNEGWMQVSVDLNGDGDFNDPGERSPVFHVATLKTEIAGPIADPGQAAVGEAMTGHLRAGIYHNPEIPCPAATGGCSVQIDNVQIVNE
jgi:hypothetical protein